KAGPHVAEARDRLRNDVIPAVQSHAQAALAEAREQAGPLAEEARRRGTAAAAALKGEQPKKRGKGRWLMLLALVGAAAVAAKKLLGGDGSGSGSHAGYVPPVPQQRTGPIDTPTGSTAGAGTESDLGSDVADDAGG